MIVLRKILLSFLRGFTPGYNRVMLALLIGLLPSGFAYGQDFDAVERRLGSAVAEGEITLSQAQVMLNALKAARKTHTPQKANNPRNASPLEELRTGIDQRLRHLRDDLRKKVVSKKITQKEMEQKYNAAERQMWDYYREAEMQNQHGESKTRKAHPLEEVRTAIEKRLRNLREELRKQVATKKITQKEMETRYEAAERKMWRQFRESEMEKHPPERKQPKAQAPKNLKQGDEKGLRQLGENLRQQVAAKKITQQEMEKRYKAAERQVRARQQKDGQSNQGNVSRDGSIQRVRKIEEAMKAGKISREEGVRAIEETKRGTKPPTRRRQKTTGK